MIIAAPIQFLTSLKLKILKAKKYPMKPSTIKTACFKTDDVTSLMTLSALDMFALAIITVLNIVRNSTAPSIHGLEYILLLSVLTSSLIKPQFNYINY